MVIGRLSMQNKYFKIKWNAPQQIKTLITTRNGGITDGVFGEFNLAKHVGANKETVEQNRLILCQDLPSNPVWLNQTHTNLILNLDNPPPTLETSYDAALTRQPNKVCVVMTADCLPIFLTDTKGSFVAAVHAGWRGLHNKIIAKSIHLANVSSKEIIAYIGPAICQEHFEVGLDVYKLFVELDPDNNKYFKIKNSNKFNCDLVAIARHQLEQTGVLTEQIYSSDQCTYCNNNLFYSYRKDNETGRFASLIWIEN